MGTYIDATGFHKKTLSTLLSEMQTDFKTEFGNDLDLAPSGTAGQLISIMTKDFADLWDGAEEIYTARDPDEATSTSLDNIIVENGIKRLEATKTTVLDVMLTGDQGVIIAAGKRAKNPNQIIEYILDSAVTIDQTVAREGYISVGTLTTIVTYTVTIDATPYAYVALITDDEEAVLTEIKTLIDAGAWGGTVTVTGNSMKIENTTPFDFDVTNLDIDGISNPGNFTADTAGACTLAANSLTEIVTPVTNWDSINNAGAGLTGRNVETDSEVRIRRWVSILNGLATDQSIAESIFNNVTGVTAVSVISNRSDIVDIDGRDAHSFESIVVGGGDTTIAEEILRTQPAGIQSFGNTTEIVNDSQGVPQTINFSRPVNQYIHVRISRSLYSEESYPANGDELIKSNIVAWSLLSANIGVGKDVIRQRLATPVYGVSGNTIYPLIPGIEDILIELDVTPNPGDTPTFTQTNITIAAREIAVFAITRITVQVL